MKRIIWFFLLTVINTSFAAAQDVTFKAAAEKTVVAGQRFWISFAMTSDGKQGSNFQAPSSFGNLNIVFGPSVQSSQSSTFINGKATSSYTESYIYTVIAPSEGEYAVGAATIKVGGKEYSTEPLTIKALPPDKAAQQQGNPEARQAQPTASSDEVFIRAVPSKTSVYENEGLLVTFKLYSQIGIQGIESVKYPEYDGFIAQEIEMNGNPQWDMENYNGRNYRTAVLKQTVLFPQREGQITIPSGKFDLIVLVRRQQRVRSIFDDFLDTSQPVQKTVSTSPITINVKPLPAGKPASFNGAAGDYKMTSSISRTELKANDAITIKLTISGTGNLKMIKNPEIVFPNDFEVYDPVVNSTSKATPAGVSGSRTIEYNAIPRYAGDFTIPKAEFSFFDLKTGTYKTLSTDEYRLHVEPGEAGSSPAPVVNAAANKEAVRYLGQDIRYIKTGNIAFAGDNHFFGTLGYLLWYIVPALLFIVLFIIYRKQAAENANIALVRTKKANKVASKRLKTAAAYLKENRQEAFYDEILKAVWGYLSDKLNIPVAALTKDNVEANLTTYGAADSLIADFRAILDTAEFARFAPSQGSGAMDTLYENTVKAIDLMENTVKK